MAQRAISIDRGLEEAATFDEFVAGLFDSLLGLIVRLAYLVKYTIKEKNS